MNPDFIADEKQKMNELNEEEPSLVKYVIKKEEINDEEPSIIKYIINKDEMFKLISNSNNKKFSRDYLKTKSREGTIKNYFTKCFRQTS